jgi:hypothetical protein
MLTAVLAVGLTGLIITAWLLAIASHAKLGTDLVNAKLDAVRTGLAAAAGAGAAVGLMLAFRRQYHQEISTALTDHDATQRRITDLYTKAVEQVGSEKAPVRLGGLYALERLAQDNQQQRETIVNVICAYLRMPFPLQAPDSTLAALDSGDTAQTEADTSPAPNGTGGSWQQEKQVRLTAQRILSDHLRRPDPDHKADGLVDSRFWGGMRLDLTGATLFDFNLDRSMIAEALFDGATFSGDAQFTDAIFNRSSQFREATFSGDAWFIRASFNDHAYFNEATFNDHAWFGQATFNDVAWFEKTIFKSTAQFDNATFSDKGGRFSEATFNRSAGFNKTIFNGDARFTDATFNRSSQFREATFNDTARFNNATFNDAAQFSEATFDKPAAIHFTGAEVRSSDNHVWPKGWQISGDSKGGLTVVRSRQH